jgi:glycine/D-amino acid oxidase-like deaminating enzyme
LTRSSGGPEAAYEVIVVGGGINGLTTAAYLSNSIWPVGTSTLGAGYVAATELARDLGVLEAQDWWRHRPLEAGLEVLRRRGIEIDFEID